MKENIDRPLAAILTLNTIAHTVGAAGVGAQAAHLHGSSAVGVASAVMTLAILVFSEIIPKKKLFQLLEEEVKLIFILFSSRFNFPRLSSVGLNTVRH